MKVHQTLVWLNLLSLGTKGLTEPTIGIQSGLCHGRGLARTASQQHSLTTLIRHFVSIKQASTLFSCIVYTDLSSQPPPCSMPAGPVQQGEPAPIGRLSLSFAYRRRKKWCQYAIQLRGMTSCRHSSQCCQVAEIPAKKLKRGHRKKKFVAEFWLILPKTGRKGAAENFQKSSLFLAVITTYNVHQDKIKFDF